MTLKRGDDSIEVRDLQVALMECGYSLPRWGDDGNLGEETLLALTHALVDQGEPHFVRLPEEVADAEIALVYQLRDRMRANRQTTLPLKLVDRRKNATMEHDYGKRAWSQVRGWTLHQTACDMGERVERYDAIGAHFVILRSGRILWMHDMNRLIVHAGQNNVSNGFNAQTVGIEIVGRFEGVIGDPSTVWDDKTTKVRETPQAVTIDQIASCKALLRWSKADGETRGARMTKLLAHRQASSSRQNDPGAQPWRDIAIPMMRELGLSDGGPGFKVDQGRPIPEAWDPTRKGIKY